MALIELKNIYKQYKDVTALNYLNLTIKEGKIIGLLGPNGSGKTTLIKIITTLLTDYQGEVLYQGRKMRPSDLANIVYMPDHPYLSNRYTVKQSINFYTTFFLDFNREKAINLISKFNIPLNKEIKKLSKGTVEKLQLVLTLSRTAKFYIFDEPLAGVDPAFREFLFSLINEHVAKDVTIMFSTHLIRDIENIIDDVVFMKEGQIILHKPKTQINEDGKTVEELFKEVFKWSLN